MRVSRMTRSIVPAVIAVLPAVIAILLGRYAVSVAMGLIRLSGEDFISEVAT